ncbi:DNA/RNA non-specific endonuclease [Siccirubricoccus phaeus]|uniref:DNA/RNA non-specific endonuclease n=1 Tax=Siccirubricoccus phaeus TaxID=2595053 RepID=UPI0011F24D1A|nr:DNA/RNA non-specific endonuclease [Siccirubricoccus phaeus]
MPDYRAKARQRLAQEAPELDRVRRLIEAGRWWEADPDLARRAAYAGAKVAKLGLRGAESFAGEFLDAIGATFLATGAARRRAVAMVEVSLPFGARTGTGFLVGAGLFLTNAHVIGDAEEALAAQAVFDREADERGRPRPTTIFRLAPERFALFSPPEALDYALVALGERLSGSATEAELGFCILSNRPDKHLLGMPVNVIQHPRGLPKLIAMRKNHLLGRTETALLYETDTDEGSSGAPVFNDTWEVVALHHWGEPHLATAATEAPLPAQVPAQMNEGVRISAIYTDLQRRLGELAEAPGALLAAVLALDAGSAGAPGEKLLSPPRQVAAPAPGRSPPGQAGSGRSPGQGGPGLRGAQAGLSPGLSPAPSPGAPTPIPRSGAAPMPQDPDATLPSHPAAPAAAAAPAPAASGLATAAPAPDLAGGGVAASPPTAPGEIRFSIPLEITLRLGAALPAAAAPVLPAAPALPLAAPPALKTLRRGAEAAKIDPDYSNRKGYSPKFIPGFSLPLPGLSASLAAAVAPLRLGEKRPEEGELRYTHFSIKLHRTRRLAIFTATNIDGPTYLAVNRDTGRVVNTEEGDTWFNDPRVTASQVLGQEFYKEWSHLFDRGHLTRRSDPTWGDKAEAERANADTFHFTNCSPQHFRFNQSATYWQGAERYVLENGVLAEESGKRISVFQGPVFDDALDLWAEDVQIPSAFFKVVVWPAAQGLKAVALVVDQKPLLGETRRFLGTPQDLPQVDVQHWRVAVTAIERSTGLDFGDEIRAADTFKAKAQPEVGAEAARRLLVRRMEDLLAE